MRKDASRSCADYGRALYMRPGAVRVVFSVRSIQAAMAPLLHRQYLSRAYLNVSDCVTHISLHMAGLYLWYATTFRVTFLSVTHHVRTYVRTHARTYVLCENRSPIQSLALMRSAITYTR